MMEVVILGSGTGVPSLKRGSPGLVVESAHQKLLFDSGPGTMRALLKAGITYQDIDGIFYTHLHTDHTADLAPFLFAAKNSLALREKPLHVSGPNGFKQFYSKLLDLYGDAIVPVSYRITIVEILDQAVDYEGWNIATKSLPHTEQSIGYRIEDSEGRKFVYSGDTDYGDAIIDLAKDADLLILECSFPDEYKVKGHLTPYFAGKIAQEAGCSKLLLTHLYPICDQWDVLSQCQKVFSGEVRLAEDGMRYHV